MLTWLELCKKQECSCRDCEESCAEKARYVDVVGAVQKTGVFMSRL